MARAFSSVRVRAPRIALFAFFTSLTLAASVATAQTVSPRVVEFDPSPDHSRSVNGVALVDGYELRFYTIGGSQSLQVLEIGKPSPESDGKIRFDFSGLLGAWPVDGVVYEAKVAAVGPGGSTASTVSNQFVFPGTTPPPPPPPPCSYTFSPTTRTVSSGATTGTISLDTGSSCTWTPTSSASWLTVTAGGGTGDGSVSYSVAAHTGSAVRSATITVGTASFTLTQSASTAPTTPVGLRIVIVR
jgi:hypothetical protein